MHSRGSVWSDSTLLVATRVTRMFAYGALSVVLALYLAEIGFSNRAIGLLLTLTLAGDAAISLGLTTGADRFGRRRTLVAGAVLMIGAGVVFAAALFLALSPRVEAAPPAVPATAPRTLGLHRSRSIVLRLSALFALDAFAGAFLVQSLLAYWFHLRFGGNETVLGGILFGVNLLAGVSALAAAWLARRIGLVNTMVATHLPSNVLLCLVPLMPTLPLPIGVLLLRFSISQMDVPTRQSYTMAVVSPDERSAAAGVTTIARSMGAAAAPALSGALLAFSLSAPFFVAGGLKIVYDGLLYRGFRAHRPPEEMRRA